MQNFTMAKLILKCHNNDLAKKEEGMFLRGVHTPMHTMNAYNNLFYNLHF